MMQIWKVRLVVATVDENVLGNEPNWLSLNEAAPCENRNNPS